MKKYLILTLAVLLTVGLAGSAMAYTAGAGITNSPHDLRGDGGLLPVAGTGEICVVCHVPHNGPVAELLWNHVDTANTTFTMYSSSSLDGVGPGSPTGISKLCLSCHDGSVGVDAYGTVAGTLSITTFSADYQIGAGGDLSDQHPISITYDDTNDLELNLSSSTYANSGTIADTLENNLIQCSSCHDVHNGPESVDLPLIRQTQAGSQLCLVCHDK